MIMSFSECLVWFATSQAVQIVDMVMSRADEKALEIANRDISSNMTNMGILKR